jgi:hypothetical protein
LVHPESFSGQFLLQDALMSEDGAKTALVSPKPELRDDTPLDILDLAPRIQQALWTAGLKTVGEVREISDDVLLGLQNIGVGSVTYLRETLGLASSEGVTAPTPLKPTG